MERPLAVRLAWWANRSLCLASFSASITIHETGTRLTAAGRLAAEHLGDRTAMEAWTFLHGLDPVFRLVFDDGSAFDVEVCQSDDEGRFSLTEYTGPSVRRVHAEFAL